MKNASFLVIIVAALNGLASASCITVDQDLGDVPAVSCGITRLECIADRPAPPGTEVPACDRFEKTSFFATICVGPNDDQIQKCADKFCPSTRDCVNSTSFVHFRNADGSDVTGICSKRADESGLKGSVTCERTSRGCELDPTRTFCLSHPVTTTTMTACYDPATQPAITMCNNAISPSSHAQIIEAHDAAAMCNSTASSGVISYALDASSTLQVSFLGTTTNLALTGGSAVVYSDCDFDGCFPSELVSLKAFYAPTTISGQLLTSISISNARPLSIRNGSTLAAGELPLVLEGDIGGSPVRQTLQNDAPVTVTTTSQKFRLSGPFSVIVSGDNLSPVAISATTTLNGTTSSTVDSCRGFNRIQQLFGFENASWHSSQASLSTVASPVTQGCQALAISGSGYQVIQGAQFATGQLPAVGNTLSVDLFIPNNQPNPFWLGALQSYLSCPSLNVFNAYIGQVELTGKPQQRFSTLSFPLPQPVASALRSPARDCAFSFALNVNQTNRSWILDNLRLR